jgi:uncharacterized membrane protein
MSTAETVYLEAELSPNSSLSARGMMIVVGIFGAVSLICSLGFWSMGALPVAGFLGVDVLALWLALRQIRKQQRERTRLWVTSSAVHLLHRAPNGAEKRAEVPTAFARVSLESPAATVSGVAIAYGQTAFVIGRYLSRTDGDALVRRIQSALRAARSERHPVQRP